MIHPVLYTDFSKALLLHPGIVRIELLTDELVKEVQSIEYSSENVGFMPIDPIGLKDITDRDLKLILFCSHEFPMFTELFMDIVDSRGTLVGHDIPLGEKEKYDSPCAIWLTDNLFFDMSLMSEHHLKTVIRSLALNLEGVEEVKPRVFYPCVSTAEHLNKRFGVSGMITATILLGVDGVRFRSLYVGDVHQRVLQDAVVPHLRRHLGIPDLYHHDGIDHVAGEGYVGIGVPVLGEI